MVCVLVGVWLIHIQYHSPTQDMLLLLHERARVLRVVKNFVVAFRTTLRYVQHPYITSEFMAAELLQASGAS